MNERVRMRREICTIWVVINGRAIEGGVSLNHFPSVRTLKLVRLPARGEARSAPPYASLSQNGAMRHPARPNFIR